MPKYIANSYLLHQGKVVQTGTEIELTKEQAERLGEKVSLIEIEEQTGDKPLQEHTVDELKEIAEERGIEDYAKLKKDELIQAIEGTEVIEQE